MIHNTSAHAALQIQYSNVHVDQWSVWFMNRDITRRGAAPIPLVQGDDRWSVWFMKSDISRRGAAPIPLALGDDRWSAGMTRCPECNNTCLSPLAGNQ